MLSSSPFHLHLLFNVFVINVTILNDLFINNLQLKAFFYLLKWKFSIHFQITMIAFPIPQ